MDESRAHARSEQLADAAERLSIARQAAQEVCTGLGLAEAPLDVRYAAQEAVRDSREKHAHDQA